MNGVNLSPYSAVGKSHSYSGFRPVENIFSEDEAAAASS